MQRSFVTGELVIGKLFLLAHSLFSTFHFPQPPTETATCDLIARVQLQVWTPAKGSKYFWKHMTWLVESFLLAVSILLFLCFLDRGAALSKSLWLGGSVTFRFLSYFSSVGQGRQLGKDAALLKNPTWLVEIICFPPYLYLLFFRVPGFHSDP